jgi:Sister chromatid cohesion protein Dcc1
MGLGLGLGQKAINYTQIRSAGTGKDWRLADFTTAWQDAVPEGVPVEVGMLAGIAITVQFGNDTFIRYLPANDVKDIPDPRDRIRIIAFEARPLDILLTTQRFIIFSET